MLANFGDQPQPRRMVHRRAASVEPTGREDPPVSRRGAAGERSSSRRREGSTGRAHVKLDEGHLGVGIMGLTGGVAGEGGDRGLFGVAHKGARHDPNRETMPEHRKGRRHLNSPPEDGPRAGIRVYKHHASNPILDDAGPRRHGLRTSGLEQQSSEFILHPMDDTNRYGKRYTYSQPNSPEAIGGSTRRKHIRPPSRSSRYEDDKPRGPVHYEVDDHIPKLFAQLGEVQSHAPGAVPDNDVPIGAGANNAAQLMARDAEVDRLRRQLDVARQRRGRLLEESRQMQIERDDDSRTDGVRRPRRGYEEETASSIGGRGKESDWSSQLNSNDRGKRTNPFKGRQTDNVFKGEWADGSLDDNQVRHGGKAPGIHRRTNVRSRSVPPPRRTPEPDVGVNKWIQSVEAERASMNDFEEGSIPPSVDHRRENRLKGRPADLNSDADIYDVFHSKPPGGEAVAPSRPPTHPKPKRHRYTSPDAEPRAQRRNPRGDDYETSSIGGGSARGSATRRERPPLQPRGRAASVASGSSRRSGSNPGRRPWA